MGILDGRTSKEWRDERAKTILDNEVNKNDPNVAPPTPGTVLEKMYANKLSTPIEYRRNKMWTDHNWRKP